MRQEGTRVLLIYNGRLVCSLPWQAAEQLGGALTAQARRAEEEALAPRIVADQALLTRLGVPFGLTRRRDLLREAANEAAWNSRLRRYVPPGRARGIETQEIFGTPMIRRHSPMEDDDG